MQKFITYQPNEKWRVFNRQNVSFATNFNTFEICVVNKLATNCNTFFPSFIDYRVQRIVDPYLNQLKPGAGKEVIKACSKLASLKIQNMKNKKKRKNETSSSDSASDSASDSPSDSASSYSSSSNSYQYTSDEDLFEEPKKKKAKKSKKSKMKRLKQTESEDPLYLSDNSQPE